MTGPYSVRLAMSNRLLKTSVLGVVLAVLCLVLGILLPILLFMAASTLLGGQYLHTAAYVATFFAGWYLLELFR